jgi:competence protein ComEA
MPFLPHTVLDPRLDPEPGDERPDPDFWGPPDRHDRHDRHDRTGRPPGLPAGPVGWGGPLERLGDRLRVWRGDPRFGVAALLVVALVAGVAWYRLGVSSSGAESGSGAPVATTAAAGPRTAPAGATTTTAAGASQDVTVHVAGAVAQPGVYELDGDSRVIDAVESAGGGVPEADLDRLNLAEKLVDGARVLVQKVGDPAAPAAPGLPARGSAPGSTVTPPGPVNVNTATQAELETLPGIGPTLAQAIIAERDRRGGFRAVNELRSVRGIGDQRFADLEPLVTL